MQTSAFLRPLSPSCLQMSAIGNPLPPKNCRRPLWTAPNGNKHTCMLPKNWYFNSHLSLRQQEQQCLFLLLRLFGEPFDLIIDDSFLTLQKDSAKLCYSGHYSWAINSYQIFFELKNMNKDDSNIYLCFLFHFNLEEVLDKKI